MESQDPFVPLPMPEPPWSERAVIVVAAVEGDSGVVPWSHGDDGAWMDAIEASGIGLIVGDALAEGERGVVASVRTMGPHYVVVLDGHDACELMALAIPVLERLRGPLPPGSRAILTRRDSVESGLRVDMVDLA